MKKLEKRDVLTYLSAYDLEGNVNNIIEIFSDIPKYLSKEHICPSNISDYYDFILEHTLNYDSSDEYHIIGIRYETDAEVLQRLKYEKEKKSKEAQRKLKSKEVTQKRERTLYEKLKKKYGQ